MGNKDHVQWLLEGVDSWNERRKGTRFDPDFEDVDLCAAFNDAGQVSPPNGIPLVNANLNHANLRGVSLGNADLSGADLRNADLRNAGLWGVNLSEASLLAADLRGAWLIEADVSGADIRGAYVNGANLTGVELWKTNMYSTAPSPEYPLDESQVIDKIEDVQNLVRQLKAFSPEVQLYYRGESKPAWELRPSVMRSGLATSEGDMLVDLISRRPQEFSGMSSALSQWVLAQHHGLPTRFLDVTKNLLVGLFHACDQNPDEDGRLHILAVPNALVKTFTSATVSIIANFAKLRQFEQRALLGKREPLPGMLVYQDEYSEPMRRLYQLIKRENPYFDERIDPRDFYRVLIVEPQQSSERIRSQSGAFLLSAFHERFERQQIQGFNKGLPVYNYYSLRIRANSKSGIISDLQSFNVSRETLFPGLDESARAVTESYHPPQGG